ncbi:hypothetical protein [Novipirellula caenicola]|uniref:Transmembrane protein n=1 Tax=Novipirellula caenicola TaxID=1536901 RepID=A0ABP9VMF6_9BACT
MPSQDSDARTEPVENPTFGERPQPSDAMTDAPEFDDGTSSPHTSSYTTIPMQWVITCISFVAIACLVLATCFWLTQALSASKDDVARDAWMSLGRC